MSIVPQPYREADLAMRGAEGIGGIAQQGYAYGVQQAAQNAPGDPALDVYLHRLIHGEDPQRLAAEAKQDPVLQDALARLHAQAQPAQPGQYVPDVGIQNGRPAVQTPGAVNPAGVTAQIPQSGLTQAPPAQQAPPQLGGQAGQPPPQSSLGAPAAAPQAQQGMLARPPARQAFIPMVHRTVAQQQRLAPFLPAMIAGASREDVARTQAQGRADSANLRAQTGVLITLLKEKGLDDRQIQDQLTKFEGLDIKAQIAAMNAAVSLMNVQTSAGATVGAARVRADTKEDPAEKELRSVQSAIANIVSKPEWTKDQSAVGEVARLTARIGELQRGVGREGVSTPGPFVGPPIPNARPTFGNQAGGPLGPVQSPPAPVKASPAPPQPKLQLPAQAKKIRVRLSSGHIGTIPEAQFDPKTMTKL